MSRRFVAGLRRLLSYGKPQEEVASSKDLMIPREILKKTRQIEIRTNRLVTESLDESSGFDHTI